jgi:hypothetical protein
MNQNFICKNTERNVITEETLDSLVGSLQPRRTDSFSYIETIVQNDVSITRASSRTSFATDVLHVRWSGLNGRPRTFGEEPGLDLDCIQQRAGCSKETRREHFSAVVLENRHRRGGHFEAAASALTKIKHIPLVTGCTHMFAVGQWSSVAVVGLADRVRQTRREFHVLESWCF